MTDRLPVDNKADERRRLIAEYDATGDMDYLRAAACLKRGSDSVDKADILTAPDSRGRGRPSEDDFDDLLQMAFLMVQHDLSRNAASRKVATERPGHSEDSKAKRLYKKFAEDPDKYLGLAKHLLAITERQRALHTIAERVKIHLRALHTIVERVKERQQVLDGIVERFHKIRRIK